MATIVYEREIRLATTTTSKPQKQPANQIPPKQHRNPLMNNTHPPNSLLCKGIKYLSKILKVQENNLPMVDCLVWVFKVSFHEVFSKHDP